MKKLLFLILITPIITNAQSIELGYSSNSIQFFGRMPAVQRLNVGYYNPVKASGKFDWGVGIRLDYINSQSHLTDTYGCSIKGRFYGAIFIPASFQYTLSNWKIVSNFGVGFFNHTFPNKNGKVSNVLLETGLSHPITNELSLSIKYSHISNAFRGVINPGLDNIITSLQYSF